MLQSLELASQSSECRVDGQSIRSLKARRLLLMRNLIQIISRWTHSNSLRRNRVLRSIHRQQARYDGLKLVESIILSDDSSTIARSGCSVVIPYREEMAKRHLKVPGDLGRVTFLVSWAQASHVQSGTPVKETS